MGVRVSGTYSRYGYAWEVYGQKFGFGHEEIDGTEERTNPEIIEDTAPDKPGESGPKCTKISPLIVAGIAAIVLIAAVLST